MNIFYLHADPKTCAQQHVDKHVVKMILEYAQLLSTAHRIVDGVESTGLSKSGRKQKVWTLSDERDAVLYKASHINHPSAKWTRHCWSNYAFLFELWTHLLDEYKYRYGKDHASGRLIGHLAQPPKKISTAFKFSAPWRAMPDEYKVSREVPDYTAQSYRAYYNGAKSHMFKWKKREVPEWVKIV